MGAFGVEAEINGDAEARLYEMEAVAVPYLEVA